MRIQFCGADRTVTGSCHLVEVNGLRILLDMGMYQGPRAEAQRLNNWLPANAKSADVLILSHGHLDHCGKIPVLTRAGYSGPIYCTPATAEVTRIVLTDAADIQEEDAAYLNRRAKSPNEPLIKPLYVSSDIPRVMQLIRRTPYNQKVDLGHGVSFTFFDAGHILGSAYVLLEWTEEEMADKNVRPTSSAVQGSSEQSKIENRKSKIQTLLFTADIGRYNTPIIRDPAPLPRPVDFVITESTYGGGSHGPMADVAPALLDAVREVIKNRSRLLVPAFAVGRTQTMLWYIQRFIQDGSIPPIPIYIDSPMGIEVTRVFQEFRDNYDEETQRLIGAHDIFAASRVTLARTMNDSKKINADPGPCVIIASSPTCEFGRILHHLTLSVERPKDIVLMVGWTPPNTLGRRLQNGERRVRIYDRWYDVACQIRTLHGLSAHADGDEIMRFLGPTLRPETSFYIVHGEVGQADALAMRLSEQGAGRALVPAMETEVITA